MVIVVTDYDSSLWLSTNTYRSVLFCKSTSTYLDIYKLPNDVNQKNTWTISEVVKYKSNIVLKINVNSIIMKSHRYDPAIFVISLNVRRVFT